MQDSWDTTQANLRSSRIAYPHEYRFQHRECQCESCTQHPDYGEYTSLYIANTLHNPRFIGVRVACCPWQTVPLAMSPSRL